MIARTTVAGLADLLSFLFVLVFASVPMPPDARAGTGSGPGVTATAMIGPVAGSPSWTAEGDRFNAQFGGAVATAGDVNGDGYSDVIVGAPDYSNGQTTEGRAFLYLGSASGLAATPAWTAESDQAGALFGASVGTAGDVNGDGYADVVVGALGYANGEPGEGRVYLYLGSPTGLSATPAWTAEGDQAFAQFGCSASTAGDVNGDGYSDVIVGARGYSHGEAGEGRAFLYLGSAAGLSPASAWTAEGDQAGAWFGNWVATAGDVNGDGYADVVIGAPTFSNGQSEEGRAYLYLGSPTGLLASPAWTTESDQADANLGIRVDAAGDVNGDGYADIVVSAPYYSNDQVEEGRVWVYLGSPFGPSSTPAWYAEGNVPTSAFGGSVGTAGDLNGDGYADLVVGACTYNSGIPLQGAVFVYLGSAAGPGADPAWVTTGVQTDARFGAAVATAGDVNGDGYAEMVIGAFMYSGSQTYGGRAYLYDGSAAGPAANPGWTRQGVYNGATFASAIAAVGDVDGDGYADVLIGAPAEYHGRPGEGTATLFRGSAAGLDTIPAWLAGGNQVNASFGASVAGAGDVNGDGYADFLVGAPAYSNGESGEGRAFLYLGSPSGLDTIPDWTAEGDQAGAQFGASVASAGDVNGDGYGDVVIGAPYYDHGQVNEGRVYLYLGSAGGLSATPQTVVESNTANSHFGASVAGAGDTNGDGYSDVIIGAPDFAGRGRAYLYPGTSSGLFTDFAAWIADGVTYAGRFGCSAGTAGDVNGDGFSDVIVGASGDEDDFGQPTGRAYLYLGTASYPGLSSVPDWTLTGSQPYAEFGRAVGTAGDVNQDGDSDILVGSPGYGDDLAGRGWASLYLGSPGGPEPDWTGAGYTASAAFGACVSTGGDTDGDGYPELIIGAPNAPGGYGNSGAAFLYPGNRGRGVGRIPRQRRTDGSAPIAGLGLSDSGSGFRLDALGRTPAGRGRVRLVCEVKPAGTAFNGTGLVAGPWTGTGAPSAAGSCVGLHDGPGGLSLNSLYHWRLRTETDSPFFPRSPWFSPCFNGATEADVRTGDNVAGVAVHGPAAPERLLAGVWPNPVLGSARIDYRLPRRGPVRIVVVDVSGREVVELANRDEATGPHQLRWDGADERGRRLPAGVYFARVSFGGRAEARKIVLAE